MAQAKSGGPTLASLIDSGVVRHYGIVLDRSDRAWSTVQSMRSSATEFRDRANSDAFKMWEAGRHPFAILWGTIGVAGGLTIGAASLEELLSHAIPAAVERSREKGGLCTFMVAVDDDLERKVQGRVASAQQLPGNASSAPATLRKRMHMATDGKQLRQLNVPRQMVEVLNTAALIAELKDCVSTLDRAQQSRQSMVVSFDGYDADPRQLWDIPEVRAFVSDVCKSVPWWPHYPANALGMMAVWTLSLREDARPSSVATNKTFVTINPVKTLEILKAGIQAAGELYARLGWVDAAADAGFAEVVDQALEGVPGNSATAAELVQWWAKLKGAPATSPKTARVVDGLLDLSLAQTGTEIDFRRVQITGPAFDKIIEILLNCPSLSEADSTEGAPHTTARQQDDGRLVVMIREPGGRQHQVVALRGEWKLLTDAEMRALAEEAKQRLKSEGARPQATATVNQAAAQQRTRAETVNTEIDQALQVILLFSKEGESLESLGILRQNSQELGPRIDAWLAGAATHFVVSMGRTSAACWTTEAKTHADLCESVLPGLAPHVLSISKTMLVPDSLNDGERARPGDVWRRLGGVVQGAA